jgi:hypothetical protein
MLKTTGFSWFQPYLGPFAFDKVRGKSGSASRRLLAMKTFIDCDYCGSAGSVEFNMCQVCLRDYAGTAERPGEEPRVSALATKVDRIIADTTLLRPPVFARGNQRLTQA